MTQTQNSTRFVAIYQDEFLAYGTSKEAVIAEAMAFNCLGGEPLKEEDISVTEC